MACVVQIGPRPAAPPGVIVKYKHGRGAQPTIAGARPGGAAPSQALDPALNLYRVQAPAGQTAAQAAAALARSSGAQGRVAAGSWGDGGLGTPWCFGFVLGKSALLVVRCSTFGWPVFDTCGCSCNGQRREGLSSQRQQPLALLGCRWLVLSSPAVGFSHS